MNILVTGAAGFVGKNLCAALKNIRDGKDRTHPEIVLDELYLYDMDSPQELLDTACENADFVFHLAGVNRPRNTEEFMEGNFGFTNILLDTLKKHGNTCPVMISSSIQAALDNPYGNSKRAGEELVFSYGKQTGAKVLVYRFPNVFGKWCRPNYNSAVATFCHNVARDLPIRVNDRSVNMTLVYIDDVVDELINALKGEETNDGVFCKVPVEHKITLGKIVDLIYTFKNQPESLVMPEIASGSFEKKLYSTYLSYLPEDKVSFPLKMNVDARGSFTELLKTEKCGQFSVNISKPGITKGQHWHHSKWEFFIVVSGKALIQQRKIDTDEVLEFKVSGDKIEAVHMLPGYTHNIINLSETEDLVTVMWANEQFDPEHPDTFFEVVK
ncbi:MAG: capsular polysaccharide biosynthesis protein CapF [Ruminococcaceae bacterium]|nr:capsular polysaccharide biosynthesis protein CapF [Oscillospiraceae bacterium]